jgi:hypothetical protein
MKGAAAAVGGEAMRAVRRKVGEGTHVMDGPHEHSAEIGAASGEHPFVSGGAHGCTASHVTDGAFPLATERHQAAVAAPDGLPACSGVLPAPRAAASSVGDRTREGLEAAAGLFQPIPAAPPGGGTSYAQADTRECKRRRIRGKQPPPLASRSGLHAAVGPAPPPPVDQGGASRIRPSA